MVVGRWKARERDQMACSWSARRGCDEPVAHRSLSSRWSRSRGTKDMIRTEKGYPLLRLKKMSVSQAHLGPRLSMPNSSATRSNLSSCSRDSPIILLARKEYLPLLQCRC